MQLPQVKKGLEVLEGQDETLSLLWCKQKLLGLSGFPIQYGDVNLCGPASPMHTCDTDALDMHKCMSSLAYTDTCKQPVHTCTSTCKPLCEACRQKVTNKFKFVIVEALVGQKLLQEGHHLAGAILVCLWHVDISQVQHQLARCLQQACFHQPDTFGIRS